MERREIEEIVGRWAEAVAEGRVEAFDALVDEAVKDTSGGAESRGRVSFKERARAVVEAFSERTVAIDALVVEGDAIAWRWTLHGTHTGPFAGIAPTGKRVTLRGANFQRVGAGRVIEHWTVADVAAVVRALSG
jgi:steroid delta-isomerase-like uncharacterized protein